MDLNHLSSASKTSGTLILILIGIFCLIWIGNHKLKDKLATYYYPIKRTCLGVMLLWIALTSIDVHANFTTDAKNQKETIVTTLKQNQTTIKKLNQKIDRLQRRVEFDKIKAAQSGNTDPQIKSWLKKADHNQNQIETDQTKVKSLTTFNNQYNSDGTLK